MSSALLLFLLLTLLFAHIDAATSAPSKLPTQKPTVRPTVKPSAVPSIRPSVKPTTAPSLRPSLLPSLQPTSLPSSRPNSKPTSRPTTYPTSTPTSHPSYHPTSRPTSHPTSRPSPHPTKAKTSSTASKGRLGAGALAGIIIAVFVVVAVGLYVARNHYHYVQRFINITGLSGYGFLDDKQERMAASEAAAGGDDVESSGDVQFSSVSNPMRQGDEASTTSDAAASGNHSPGSSGMVAPPGSPGSPGSPSGKKKGLDHESDGHEVTEHVTVVGLTKAGFLMKRSTHKSWLKRFFFIKEGRLYYTHKAIDETTAKKGVSAVLVANLLISTVRNPSSREFQIISPGQRGNSGGGGVYELMAETEEEAAEWVRVVKQQIEGSLTSNLPASSEEEVNTASFSSVKFVPNAAVLKEVRAVNPLCADCLAPHPDWASLNLCILICIECSGIHRSLGSHISKVRSITLDKWSNNSIKLLNMIGNTGANSVWESKLTNKAALINPKSEREPRERFIESKYVKKEFVARYETDENFDIEEMLASCKVGDCINVMRYLAQGLSVNCTSSSSGDARTPLLTAVAAGQVLCVELLCQWGASLDAMDVSGQNAMALAKATGNQAVIDILVGFSAAATGAGSPSVKR